MKQGRLKVADEMLQIYLDKINHKDYETLKMKVNVLMGQSRFDMAIHKLESIKYFHLESDKKEELLAFEIEVTDKIKLNEQRDKEMCEGMFVDREQKAKEDD